MRLGERGAVVLRFVALNEPCSARAVGDGIESRGRWTRRMGYDLAHGHLVALERKGAVRRDGQVYDERTRGFGWVWRVTDAGRVALAEAEA